MPTVAGDLDNVLIIRISAVIAAIFVVPGHRTAASAVCASAIVFICHSVILPYLYILLARKAGTSCAGKFFISEQ
jgi:hypothetical protein